ENFLHSLLRHDVRNKIQIIQGYNELLEDFDLPEEAEKYITKGNKGAEEAAEVIEKVRTLREAQEEEIGAVGIKSAVNEAINQARSMAEEKGIEIEADCFEEGCEVLGGTLLDRVFSNIIENAIQHSEGSKIRIHGERGEDEIVCTIEDDGRGIPDDEKERVFDKGYTTDQARGTGLGMFLVKTLLEIYGGSIEIKDSDLGGARFDVRLKKA
ncbi:MAG: sensor histidine kinase, partial [Candidatus Aenigmatarchaeota archaeon]